MRFGGEWKLLAASHLRPSGHAPPLRVTLLGGADGAPEGVARHDASGVPSASYLSPEYAAALLASSKAGGGHGASNRGGGRSGCLTMQARGWAGGVGTNVQLAITPCNASLKEQLFGHDNATGIITALFAVGTRKSKHRARQCVCLLVCLLVCILFPTNYGHDRRPLLGNAEIQLSLP